MQWCWANLKHSVGIFLDEVRKTTNTSVCVAGVPADITTRQTTNIRIVPYLLSVVADAMKA